MGWRFWPIGLFTVVVLAITGWQAYVNIKADANSRAVQAALLKYSHDLKPGASRKTVKDYLRGQGTRFMERCCDEPGGPSSVLVQVGKENSPWYCSEWPDYAAFEFSTTEPRALGFQPADSDILKGVRMTSNGEGCL